jgi:hypothetical protein
MITKGKRLGGQPSKIIAGEASTLERIPLEEKVFNEDWIQELIFKNPSLLSVHEIDKAYDGIIPIGREINTPVGPIDNLFINTDGCLTLVETKLWRNPQARREVVGQIIDYAKEIIKWSYSDLDNSVRTYNSVYHNQNAGLLETIKSKVPMDDMEEKEFVDNVVRNIKRGRFLLLIVGDGIRESVEDMIDYLSLTPQIQFTLALIELQVHSLNKEDNSLLVIPQLVTRTKEITRAVVRIEDNTLSNLAITVNAEIENKADSKNLNQNNRFSITAEDYFEQLQKNTSSEIANFARQVIKDAEEKGFFIDWNSGSFGIKLLDPQGSGVKISILNVDRNGLIYLGYCQNQLNKLGLPLELSYKLAKETAELLPGILQNTETKYTWNKYSTLKDLKPVYEDFMKVVLNYVEALKRSGERNSE